MFTGYIIYIYIYICVCVCVYSYLSPTSDPPQNGRVESLLQRLTIQGNSPFLAGRPPTILSHSNLLIKSSANKTV